MLPSNAHGGMQQGSFPDLLSFLGKEKWGRSKRLVLRPSPAQSVVLAGSRSQASLDFGASRRIWLAQSMLGNAALTVDSEVFVMSVVMQGKDL